jgi:hypothetical protein
MAQVPRENHSPDSQLGCGLSIPRSLGIRAIFVADVIASISIPPNGFALPLAGILCYLGL